jgi:hypothetical protein
MVSFGISGVEHSGSSIRETVNQFYSQQMKLQNEFVFHVATVLFLYVTKKNSCKLNSFQTMYHDTKGHQTAMVLTMKGS